MSNDKSLRILGLALKAGKASVGTLITEKLIKDKKAKLVLIAQDGSIKQKDKIINLCKSINIKYIETSTKEELGKISGRTMVLCIAVTDMNFTNGILNSINNGGA